MQEPYARNDACSESALRQMYNHGVTRDSTSKASCELMQLIRHQFPDVFPVIDYDYYYNDNDEVELKISQCGNGLMIYGWIDDIGNVILSGSDDSFKFYRPDVIDFFIKTDLKQLNTLKLLNPTNDVRGVEMVSLVRELVAAPDEDEDVAKEDEVVAAAEDEGEVDLSCYKSEELDEDEI